MHFNRSRIFVLVAVFVSVLLITILASPQYYKSELKPPPPSEPESPTYIPADTLEIPARVQPTVPVTAEDYLGEKEYAADLRTPSNIKTEAVYDPASGMYVIRTLVGDREIVTPYMMTAEEYNNMMMRRDLFGYFTEKNLEDRKSVV